MARVLSDFGQRLRAIRKAKGWRMSDVSRLTGLAISTISKVENGQMSLTYDKLQQLARGLSLDMASLFSQASEPAAKSAVTARRSVDRVSDATHIAARGYDYWFLNTDLSQKKMVPIVGETTARSLTDFGELLRHEGEEFIYVLSGRIEVHTEFYSPLTLGPGESVYIDSNMGHAYLAASDEPCRILCVCAGGTTEETMRAIQAEPGEQPRGQSVDRSEPSSHTGGFPGTNRPTTEKRMKKNRKAK
jgi:transcriptional regulator with XRE-family HTH domain